MASERHGECAARSMPQASRVTAPDAENASKDSTRQPHTTVLYGLVRDHDAGFQREASEAHDKPILRCIDSEIGRCLACRDFTRGYVHLRCTSWATDVLASFSCRSRTLCPGCAGRRWCAQAAPWWMQSCQQNPFDTTCCLSLSFCRSRLHPTRRRLDRWLVVPPSYCAKSKPRDRRADLSGCAKEHGRMRRYRRPRIGSERTDRAMGSAGSLARLQSTKPPFLTAVPRPEIRSRRHHRRLSTIGAAMIGAAMIVTAMIGA